MRKVQALSQTSKISDFFSKVPSSQMSQTTSNSPKQKRRVSSSKENEEKCKRIKYETRHEEGNKSVSGSFEVTTPTKKFKPSSTPSKKMSGSGGKSQTPSSRRSTPRSCKKSPIRPEEFNIKLLESYFNMSPSTSTANGFNCSQRSIKPSVLNSHSPAQNHNETTPTKSQRKLNLTPSLKSRLNFSDLNDKENIKQEPPDTIKEEVFDAFEDDLFGLEEALDLSEPQHCKVTNVSCYSKHTEVQLQSTANNSVANCIVEEFWIPGKNFAKGDTVLVQAEEINGKWVVNNLTGWLVYQPDLLIPCTSVVGSLFCKRKGVLADKFRGLECGNRNMIVGIITHSLLQQALKNNLKTEREVEDLLQNILKSTDTIKRLYESSLTLDEIEFEVQAFIPKLVTFISKHIDSNQRPSPADWQGRITSIEDIEENLWCPDLGIKGKIDVTLQTDSGATPLELKTGRATVSMEHRGQVILYLMMMNKFKYKASSGLLLYLREGVLKEVKPSSHEQRGILALRNELAYFLGQGFSGDVSKAPEMPEPLFGHRACAKCPYNVLCTSYLKYERHDISKDTSLQEVQKEVTKHLSQEHLDYFLRWSNLLALEEESHKLAKSMKQIYTVEPETREALGRCIINVKVAKVGDDENGLFKHTFKKLISDCNLTRYDIVENDYVVVSTDERPAVATGFVREVSVSQICVLLDRNLNNKYPNRFFHLDTYDSNISLTFNMTSLALLLENTPRAAELRHIIIEKRAPTFLAKLPSIVATKGVTILKRLNPVQQRAVLRALCANEFLLIKGMPGTGKSATIVALIQLLVELNKSVLITSHTHSAIDNICIRLKKRNIEFLRLGSESKVDASLKPNLETSVIRDCKTPQEIEEVYNKYKVIAVTCLGSGHPLISKRTVDVCIVDESTQVLQISVIKSLYAAKTFVLIGDPHQLAPLVKNTDAINGGMAQSLFERLESPEGTIVLNLNYRMNKTIGDLANVLTYEGQLQPASDEIAMRTLRIPDLKTIRACYSEHAWLVKAMDTSLEGAVQLIDTGPVWQAPEETKNQLKSFELTEMSSDSQNWTNVYETSIVVTLVKALLKGGVASNDVGVIATYRAQVSQISNLLQCYNVEVSTVDQFQGRDKNVIIYSCAKSAKSRADTSKTELLEDKRRLTVAITRAKRKLLIVGDVSTLQKFSTFASILPALQTNIIKFDSPWNSLNDC